jgi:hypothetical protein
MEKKKYFDQRFFSRSKRIQERLFLTFLTLTKASANANFIFWQVLKKLVNFANLVEITKRN